MVNLQFYLLMRLFYLLKYVFYFIKNMKEIQFRNISAHIS